MTLVDLQHHLLVTCDSLYCCAAVSNILTDIARHMFPLW